MENKQLPWKNLTAKENNDDVREMKTSLMQVLQNFAQFSIDPNEVIDVSMYVSTSVFLKHFFLGLSIHGMKYN